MITLYGVPHSMYAGRGRSYLIKAGVPYRELPPNSDHFLQVVVPKAGGRSSMPTIEFENGDVIRDSTSIIDYFEVELGYPFTPRTPKQNLISRLLDAIGSEGMLRPILHYRWSFDLETPEFFKYQFETLTGTGEGRDGMADLVMDYMRKATKRSGVTPDTIPVIEAIYLDQLKALDRHFTGYGYLLGGRPCIGDFGFIAPLFAHLGRDPRAISLMHHHAPRVLRWTERMNRHASDLVEYENQDESWVANDEIPDTLVDLLCAMAEDFVPETLAAAQRINAWIAEQDDLAPGTPCERAISFAEFELRGIPFSANAQPYRFYLLKRVQDAYDALDTVDKAAIDAILDASNMTPVLAANLTRGIALQDNVEVWL